MRPTSANLDAVVDYATGPDGSRIVRLPARLGGEGQRDGHRDHPGHWNPVERAFARVGLERYLVKALSKRGGDSGRPIPVFVDEENGVVERTALLVGALPDWPVPVNLGDVRKGIVHAVRGLGIGGHGNVAHELAPHFEATGPRVSHTNANRLRRPVVPERDLARIAHVYLRAHRLARPSEDDALRIPHGS